MIKDLQKFGRWLDQNNLVDFGKNVKNDEYIFLISYDGNDFFFDSFNSVEDSSLNYCEFSIFNNDLLISTDQSFMIPNSTDLQGFSPFFLKLGKFKDATKISSLKNKIEGSLKSNGNDGSFIKFINLLFDNFDETLLEKFELSDSYREILTLIDENIDKQDIINLIKDYYTFILENHEDIIRMIKEYGVKDSFDKEKIIYLACIFGDYNDLINDFFYICTDFYKKRNEKIKDDTNGICSICGEKHITYPNFPYFKLDEVNSFNYTTSNANLVKNSKLKICRNCNRYIKYANDKLFFRIIRIPNIAIIPKIKKGSFNSFLEISNKEINNFDKINIFLKELSGEFNINNSFNFDLIIYNWNDKRTNVQIKRYIENYKAFLVQFKELFLYDKNKLNYLFGEKLFNDDQKDDLKKNKISNSFDFEFIFKEVFCSISENKVKYPHLNHFHEIFIKDLNGPYGIFRGESNSKIVSLFSKYSENIFSFIYEINLEALNKQMVNELFTNSLMIFQKNNSSGWEASKYQILKRLNYYYFIKKEILGDDMLLNDNIEEIKSICKKYDDEGSVIFDENDETNLIKLINEDIALKYYLLGQFIRLLDNMKGINNKNSNVFSNLISNANKNNLRKLFITEILQKNNFYIEKMNKKGKFIFKLFESDIDSIFEINDSFEYEDYILLLFTGYYTTCVLSSCYENKSKKCNKNRGGNNE